MVSKVSAEYVQPVWDGIGAMVIGRHLFAITNGWQGTPPAGEHVVVVSALALGLVDEMAMDVVPVVFGSGKRYFGSVDRRYLLEDPDVVIRGDRVLHLRYRVRRWLFVPRDRAEARGATRPGTRAKSGGGRQAGRARVHVVVPTADAETSGETMRAASTLRTLARPTVELRVAVSEPRDRRPC